MRKTLAVLFTAHLLGLPLASLTARAEPPERIVAVGGDVTEILFAVGAGARIVAVDSTSLYPRAAQDIPNVGYMRRLSPEPILALAPDHIIAIDDAGPAGAIDVLRQAGVRFTTIEDQPTIDGVIEKIERVADAVGANAAGKALAEATRQKVEAALAAVDRGARRPRAVFLLSVGRGAMLAGGRGTSADAIIVMAGGENIASEIEGYKPIEPEAMNARDPELVMVTYRTLEAMGGVDAVLASPLLAGTTAGKTGRVVAFDGLMLLGFGPRLADSIQAVSAALRPAATQ